MRFTKQAIENKTKLRMPIASAIKSMDESKRQITFIASTESVDRYGDTVRVDGWDTANYEKNPVCLWAHDSCELPVGKCVGIMKQLGKEPALLQTIQFATAAENPKADAVYRLYLGGYLSAVSVGFIPKAWEFRYTSDAEGNPEGWPTGVDFLSQELLELSCVPVPANPEALALMMKGLGDGLHGADLAKMTMFGVIDKAIGDKALTVEAGEELKTSMAASFTKKILLGDDDVVAEKTTPEVVPPVETAAAEVVPTAVVPPVEETAAAVPAVKDAPAATPITVPLVIDTTESKKNLADLSEMVKDLSEKLTAVAKQVEEINATAKAAVVVPEVVATEVEKTAPVTSAAVVEPTIEKAPELILFEKIFSTELLPTTSAAVEGKATQNLAPEVVNAPEKNGDDTETVSKFMASLFTV